MDRRKFLGAAALATGGSLLTSSSAKASETETVEPGTVADLEENPYGSTVITDDAYTMLQAGEQQGGISLKVQRYSDGVGLRLYGEFFEMFIEFTSGESEELRRELRRAESVVVPEEEEWRYGGDE